MYMYIYNLKLVDFVESMSQFKGSKLWIFMEYQEGRDLKDHLLTTGVRRAFGVASFASQDLSQESNTRKRKGLFPSPPTHPDLPLALGHKPGRICELSLVLGKGLAAAGDLESLARRGQPWAGHGWGGFVKP